MLKGIVIGAAGFALYVPLQVAIFRVLQPRWRFASMVRLYLALVPLCAGAYLWTPSFPAGAPPAGALIGLANGLAVYTFLFVGLSMFYFLVDRGFSVRMLIEVEGAGEAGLGLEEILRRYPPEGALARRLSELETHGRLARQGDALCLTRRGVLDARMFLFVKRFLRLGEGG